MNKQINQYDFLSFFLDYLRGEKIKIDKNGKDKLK